MIKPQKNSNFLLFELSILLFLVAQALFCALVPSFFAAEYLVVAITIGFFLYVKEKSQFYYFVFMIWAVTPFFRRLADLQMGWNPNNPMMITPLALCGLTVFSLLKFDKSRNANLVFPLLLIGLALAFAFAYGMFNFGLLPSLYEGSIWTLPIIFGLSLVIHEDEHEKTFMAIVSLFRNFLFVGGAYGVYQFIAPPIWDVYWMINVPLASIGSPYPFMVRVYSTLNSPNVFAQYMITSLLVCNELKTQSKWLGLILGYGSFLLSMVRSAWGGWLLSFMVMAGSVKLTNLYRFIFGLATMGLVIFVSAQFDPIGAIIEKRFSTFTNLEQDVSFRARMYQYDQFFEGIINEPMGIGFGNASNSGRLGERTRITSFQNVDSGIANIFAVFGWIGTLFYLVGLGLLIFRKPIGLRVFADRGMSATAFAILLQVVFFNVFVGPVGVLLWAFVFLRLCRSTPDFRLHSVSAPHIGGGRGI